VRARPSRSRASCADTSTPPWVIDSLQHPAVRRAVAHEAAFDDLGPGDRGVAHRVLSAIFKAAVADRRLASSPFVGTRLPKIEKRKVEPISTEQVRALVEAVPDRYRTLVLLAVGTGMAQGEVFGLTVDRVDFLRRSLTVDRNSWASQDVCHSSVLPTLQPAFG
jgi:integrase